MAKALSHAPSWLALIVLLVFAAILSGPKWWEQYRKWKEFRSKERERARELAKKLRLPWPVFGRGKAAKADDEEQG